ncbi:hypothetical protein N3K66_002156 [Trichothecium roseum]|uniref:Uncharacterized protein n=1 Tax=Trichothecium roseum TaxID=47278 RepID=A0ACC0V9B2_9HYPO|nr:hypothetical protein N3K66_002156 [Trichothecium roseum]
MPTTTTTNTASNPILLLLPTPLAALSTPYIDLYRSLHADAAFCRMGFGAGFAARSWTRDECADVVRQRDVRPGWMGEGGDLEMGDFAVGLVRDDDLGARLLHGGGGAPVAGRRSVGKEGGIQILEGDAFRRAFGDNITTTTNTTSSQDGEDDDEPFKGVEWVGYAGVRDAKRSMPPRSPSDAPLPPPQELVELRYGVAPSFWGKGIAPRAAEAVMAWAAAEKGVRRFVAETEADNERSGKVLGRMGFRVCATDYWKDEGQLEWERVV